MTTTMTRDDVMRETVKHVRRVGVLMLEAITQLQHRAVVHDDSKFTEAEFEAFAQETPGLRQMTYGSEEYQAALERLGPALKHHYRHNSHHPEHFHAGVSDMSLLDLIEMLADWKAATERHEDGSLARSITQNAIRFGYGDAFARLLARTAVDLGWMTYEECESTWVPESPAREIVEEIARQRTTAEMDDEEREDADFEGAYDHMVKQAREAMK